MWQQVPLTSWQIIPLLFLQENKNVIKPKNNDTSAKLNHSDRLCWFEVNLLYYASEQKEQKEKFQENFKDMKILMFTISKHETPKT